MLAMAGEHVRAHHHHAPLSCLDMRRRDASGEPPPSHVVGKPPSSGQAVLGFEEILISLAEGGWLKTHGVSHLQLP